jgi:hypothetical protein
MNDDVRLNVAEPIENSGRGKNTLTQHQCDDKVSTPLAVLTLVDDASCGADGEMGVDPYNTGYVEFSRTWPPRSRK